MTSQTTDPRPQLAAALDQTQRQVDLIRPDQLRSATPCPDFDAGTMIAHLVAVLRKLAVVSRGGDMTGVADPAIDVGDDDGWAAFRRARDEFETAWTDGLKLGEEFAVPWGSMTGKDLLDAYVHEFTVHAWDLAQVTGSRTELDPDLAEAALDWFGRNIGPENRGEGGPYGPIVPVAPDADSYTRLTGFVGRAV